MNLRCLIGGHDWRLAEPWQNAALKWGEDLIWGMGTCLDGTVCAGQDLRVQCACCGARAMAEFQRREDWVKHINTGWQLRVKHWRGGLVADTPPSDEVEAAIRGKANRS